MSYLSSCTNEEIDGKKVILVDISKMYTENDLNKFFNILDSILRNQEEGYARINDRVFKIKLDLIDVEEIGD